MSWILRFGEKTRCMKVSSKLLYRVVISSSGDSEDRTRIWRASLRNFLAWRCHRQSCQPGTRSWKRREPFTTSEQFFHCDSRDGCKWICDEMSSLSGSWVSGDANSLEETTSWSFTGSIREPSLSREDPKPATNWINSLVCQVSFWYYTLTIKVLGDHLKFNGIVTMNIIVLTGVCKDREGKIGAIKPVIDVPALGVVHYPSVDKSAREAGFSPRKWHHAGLCFGLLI